MMLKPNLGQPDPPVAKAIVKYKAQVMSLAVRDPEERTAAIAFIQNVKARREEVVGFFADMKKKAHDAWKAITSKEAGFLKDLDEIERSVKGFVLAYDGEQEEIRLAAERQLQAEADAKAEQERKALLAKAQKAKGERKQELLAQAREVEAEKVEVAPSLEYEEGESTRLIWKARVVDESKVPRSFMSVDLKRLNAVATTLKENAQVPGVEFYPEKSLAVGRGM